MKQKFHFNMVELVSACFSTSTNRHSAQGDVTLNSSRGSSTPITLQQHLQKREFTPNMIPMGLTKNTSHGTPAPALQRSISAPTGDSNRNVSLNLTPVQEHVEDDEPLVLTDGTRNYVNEVLFYCFCYYKLLFAYLAC